MRRSQPPSRHIIAAACFMLMTGACAQDPPETSETQAVPVAGCLASGEGSLEAELRGALVADLAWKNAVMLCDGSSQPDGSSMRVTIAGPLPGHARLRFIFGIDLHDTASGSAQAFPTNLTAIVEGNQELYSTRGTDKCAVETLQRTPVAGSNGTLDRVKVRGYCFGPVSDIPGNTRLLVPTFSFTALVKNGDDP